MEITEQWGKVIKNAIRSFKVSKELNDDLVQECYVRIVELRDTIDGIHRDQGVVNASKFVTKICRNRCVDLLRAQNHYESLLDRDREAQIQITETASFDDIDMDKSIKTLTREEQYVIRGIFYLDKTEQELARETGKSRQWVSWIKTKAIAELKQQIG